MVENRHICITGGAGYIGSQLCSTLLARGNWVSVVDSLMFGGNALLTHACSPRFHFLHADVATPGVLASVIEQTGQRGFPTPYAVVHLAAVVGFPACREAGREKVWRTNVEALKRVFEDADQLGVERFVFSSTYSVYGRTRGGEPVSETSPLNPQSLYGESKIAGEEFLLSQTGGARCSPLVFRFATLHGVSARMRFDLIVNQFVLEAYSRGELRIYQAGYSRSFVHIRDVVDGLTMGLKAPEAKVRSEIYNLGDDAGNHTKEEIVSLIQEALPDTKVQYETVSFSEDMRRCERVFFESTPGAGFSRSGICAGRDSGGVELAQNRSARRPFRLPLSQRPTNPSMILVGGRSAGI